MEETVFEHNITSYELEWLKINLNKEQYLKYSSTAKKYYHLFMLFKFRNDNIKAEEILNRLSLKLVS